jgi:hypothetical protein
MEFLWKTRGRTKSCPIVPVPCTGMHAALCAPAESDRPPACSAVMHQRLSGRPVLCAACSARGAHSRGPAVVWGSGTCQCRGRFPAAPQLVPRHIHSRQRLGHRHRSYSPLPALLAIVRGPVDASQSRMLRPSPRVRTPSSLPGSTAHQSTGAFYSPRRARSKPAPHSSAPHRPTA